MHPFSILALGIFVAGYITARWDLIAQLYAVATFAWEHGVVVSGQIYLVVGILQLTPMIIRRLERHKDFFLSLSALSVYSFR